MRPQIVLFGDSITEQSFSPGGWGAAMADDYARKADIVLRGYTGYNTRLAVSLLHHIFPLKERGLKGSLVVVEVFLKGIRTPPRAVTIFFGASDAALKGSDNGLQHVPIEEYRENLRIIIRHLEECSPDMIIVLITPPPVDEAARMAFLRSTNGDKAMELPERKNDVTGAYAKSCIDLSQELGILSIDLWHDMMSEEGWQDKFLSDGLHLTPEGNAFVHEEIMWVIGDAGLSPPSMPYDFPHIEIDGSDPEIAFQDQIREMLEQSSPPNPSSSQHHGGEKKRRMNEDPQGSDSSTGRTQSSHPWKNETKALRKKLDDLHVLSSQRDQEIKELQESIHHMQRIMQQFNYMFVAPPQIQPDDDDGISDDSSDESP